MNERERNNGFTHTEEKKVPVEARGEGMWKGIPKGQRGIDELNIWLRHIRWEVTVCHDKQKRSEILTEIGRLEKEIERRLGK